MASSDPQPFRVNVPETDLDLLQQRLKLTRFPDELDEAGWHYGVPLADVKRLVARWREGYDWRKAEAEINRLPQFTRDIDVDGFGTLNIHYVHQRSTVEKAIPLLFVHGWPGHFLEVRKILPLLVSESSSHPSFHVVALSLPGYGFSQGPKKKGFKSAQYAEVGNKLMLSLGYNDYVTQGGDWGHLITRKMAELYGGKSLRAWHTNIAMAKPPSLTKNPLYWLSHMIKPYTESERAGFERTQWMRRWGSGYMAEQSTRPQTVGYALADSPVGLLAWIYEKLVEWTDGYPWTDDEVLTWVSIYWFSRDGPAASVRIYYEIIGTNEWENRPPITSVPTGVSYFPKELFLVPKSWVRASLSNVTFESEHARGGHFAAHEMPQELVDDLRRMFGKSGPSYNVVKGKSGYPSSDTRL